MASPRPDRRLELAYRLVNWRLGPQFRQWVYADVRSKGWPLRQAAVLLPAMGIPLAVIFTATGSTAERVVFPLVAVFILMVFLRGALMERALRQQGLDLDGEVDAAATWYDDDQDRRKRNLTGAVTTVALVLGAFVLLSVQGD